ncbi:hypothetical protein SAMN05660199_02933 [Klenkia soli]|uniref:Uncharacterized protein n=1 Tax=Klenkia soli TaxID=1052260 RepID=A0A1H0P137_9ACTN|nr:hypothetical protein [Klenkia soli]SDO98661.1 hypothetical protein SAMN05660199_02933 [Klenkia soli]
MTLLEHPALAPADAPARRARPDGSAPTWLLLIATTDPDRAGAALRRETRARDLLTRDGDDVVVHVTASPADLDAVADRLLTVVERATGRPAAAGLCLVGGDRTDDEVLRRARAGLRVAWSCGGSRVVRHP